MPPDRYGPWELQGAIVLIPASSIQTGVAEFGGNAAPAESRPQCGADVHQCRVTLTSQSLRSSPANNWWFEHVAGLKKFGGKLGMEAWKRTEEWKPQLGSSFVSMMMIECASTVLARWARQHATASRVCVPFYLCFRLLATPPIIGYSRQEPAKYVLRFACCCIFRRGEMRHNYLKSCMISLALWSKG